MLADVARTLIRDDGRKKKRLSPPELVLLRRHLASRNTDEVALIERTVNARTQLAVVTWHALQKAVGAPVADFLWTLAFVIKDTGLNVAGLETASEEESKVVDGTHHDAGRLSPLACASEPQSQSSSSSQMQPQSQIQLQSQPPSQFQTQLQSPAQSLALPLSTTPSEWSGGFFVCLLCVWNIAVCADPPDKRRRRYTQDDLRDLLRNGDSRLAECFRCQKVYWVRSDRTHRCAGSAKKRHSNRDDDDEVIKYIDAWLVCM